MDNLNKEQTLSLPIISDILGGPIPKGKVLVGLYEPSAQWLSLILTIALELAGLVCTHTKLTGSICDARTTRPTHTKNGKRTGE